MSTAEQQGQQLAEGGADPLAALEAQASALEGAAMPQGPAAPEAAVPDTAAELLGALELFRMGVAPAFAWWPEFGVSVWHDAQLRAIAKHGGAIMDRHGWTVGEMAGQWGPYIGLAVATVTPAIATYQAVQARRAELEAHQREQARRQRAAPPEEAEGVRP